MATKLYLLDQIASNVALMVAKAGCPFCKKAGEYLVKSGFTDKDVKVVYGFDVENSEELMNTCQELTGAKTFPRVWINSKFIGGCDDIITNYMNGSLTQIKYDMILSSAAKELVDSSISTAKVVMISKKTCPPCTEVKMMLEEVGFTEEQVKVITISDWSNMEHIQRYCEELTGDRSTPRVWIDGKIVGGLKQVQPMFESGELEKMALEN